MARAVRFGVCWVLVLLLAACSGQTGAATDVDQTGARLNASGSAGPSGSFYFFEYARSASDLGTSRASKTPTRRPGAGASGAFSETVRGLTPSSGYVFRACGADNGSSQAFCAATRSFATRAGGLVSPSCIPTSTTPIRFAIGPDMVYDVLAVYINQPNGQQASDSRITDRGTEVIGQGPEAVFRATATPYTSLPQGDYTLFVQPSPIGLDAFTAPLRIGGC